MVKMPTKKKFTEIRPWEPLKFETLINRVVTFLLNNLDIFFRETFQRDYFDHE